MFCNYGAKMTTPPFSTKLWAQRFKFFILYFDDENARTTNNDKAKIY